MSSSRAGLSKEELLVVIDNQAEQIKRFELRLRDTVSACKSLMKQKEALEASLQVLHQPKNPTEDVSPYAESTSQPAANDSDAASMPSSSTPSSTEDVVTGLRQHISTLSQSLATITSEKVRLEQLVVAEKKSLRAECEGKIESILADKERQAEEIRELRLRLQKAFTSGDSVGDSADTSPRRPPNRATPEQQLAESYQPGFPLVERLRSQLRETEAKLFALQQTCMTKDAETICLEAERERADRAELLAGESEVRLRVLEQRIADMTTEMGRYEQSSVRDKRTIEKLEAKLRDLQQANPPKTEPKSQQQGNQIHPRRTATFGTQTDFSALSAAQPSTVKIVETDHSLCQDRISTLERALACARQDFAEAVQRSWLANASNPPPKAETEAVSDEKSVDDRTPDLLLRPVPQHLRSPSSGEITKNSEQEDQQRFSPEGKQKLGTALSIESFSHITQQNKLSMRSPTEPNSDSNAFDYLSSSGDVIELQQATRTAGGPAAPLLFYETEMSRLDSSLRDARGLNRKLERRYRETEQRLVAEKIALQQSLDRLQCETEELRRATRTMPPDSAKLEFIRQILMRHLSTADPKVRSQTATVLATALSFPPDFAASSSSAGGPLSAASTRFFKS